MNATTTHPLLGWHIVQCGVKKFTPGTEASLLDCPLGVELVAQPAECTPPVLVPDKPWEGEGLSHFHLVREDDRFRLWYSCLGGALCYAESEDGCDWRKPDLHLRDFDGSTANNIASDNGWPCCCWFEDAGAAAEQRYKTIGLEASWIDKDGNDVTEKIVQDAMTHRMGEEGEDGSEGFGIRSDMVGYVSPDRFRWRKLEIPSLMDIFSDSQAVVWYDPGTRLYRGYFRTTWVGKRAVGYAETEDFEHWPLPEVVFHALPQDGPDGDWGLMYMSTLHCHNDEPFKAPSGHHASCYRLARWKPHRLVGISAADEGRFTLKSLDCRGGDLKLNYRTEPGGWVRVELTDRESGYPPNEVPSLLGYSFADCDPMQGDEIERTVTWKGSSAFPALPDKKVVIRIRMARATVFAATL